MEALTIVQIVLTVLLIVCILLQRGTSGLGTVFGGSVVDNYRSKRGFEAFIYNFTIIIGVLFVANTLAIAIVTV